MRHALPPPQLHLIPLASRSGPLTRGWLRAPWHRWWHGLNEKPFLIQQLQLRQNALQHSHMIRHCCICNRTIARSSGRIEPAQTLHLERAHSARRSVPVSAVVTLHCRPNRIRNQLPMHIPAERGSHGTQGKGKEGGDLMLLLTGLPVSCEDRTRLPLRAAANWRRLQGRPLPWAGAAFERLAAVATEAHPASCTKQAAAQH